MKKTRIKNLKVLMLMLLIVTLTFTSACDVQTQNNPSDAMNSVDNVLKDVGDILSSVGESAKEVGKPILDDLLSKAEEALEKETSSTSHENASLELFEGFKPEELREVTFEEYSPLDSLGRTGEANALLHKSMMPREERESLSSVTPSGWKNKKYDIVSGGWVYNRAHLIGFQLSGQQANELNLMTGTRQMNVDGMLPYENQVADFLKASNKNYVRYRVKPIYEGDNLLASGVVMEAVGFGEQEMEFSVYVPNEQEGILIDYKTGETQLAP